MTGTESPSLLGPRMRGWPVRVLTAAALAALVAPLDAQVAVQPRTTDVTVGSARGWLGVNVAVLHHAGGEPERILVEDVWEGGPALEAGLRAGDRILRVNGVAVSGERFRSLTRRLEPGDPMTLLLSRDGREMEVTLVAGERPDPGVLVPRELQHELDAVRVRLTRILEGNRVRLVAEDGNEAAVQLVAPTFVVERVRGDSITTRIVLHSDSLDMRARIAAGVAWDSGGVVLDASAPRAPNPVPFRIWVRSGDSVAPAAVHVARRPGESPERRAAEEFMVAIQGSRAGASTVTAEERPVRPLAPYLAGMNRVAGAEMRPMTPELAPYFGVDSGVLVTSVAEETPAGHAGLRAGDVVLEVNGTPVSSVAELREILAGFRGPPVLQLLRKGERIRVELF